MIYCSRNYFEKEHKIISKLKGRLIIFGNKACMHFATHNMMKNVPLPPPDEKQSRGNKSHFSSTLKGARTRPLCLCNLVEIMLFHNNVYIICLSKGTYVLIFSIIFMQRPCFYSFLVPCGHVINWRIMKPYLEKILG